MGLIAPQKDRASDGRHALDRLAAATQSDMERVNALILERADSHVEMVPKLARHLIDAGGKRLRPMLTLASASLFGGGIGHQIRFAAAVEFMHNATLLHDDVVDESDLRRGKPAARMVWGNQASVLVGDFLLGQAFQMMVETRDIDALGVLSRAAAIIAEGEVFQLSKSRDLAATPEDYMQVIRAKTATLFEAAAHVGARAGGASPEACAALSRYGTELGCAFQLVDDVLDYGGASGVLGKNTGDDLREGKMTLPIILALSRADAGERETIHSGLGNSEADSRLVGEVLAIIERHGGLKETLALASTHADAARAALGSLPPGKYRTLLEDVATFCVERAY